MKLKKLFFFTFISASAFAVLEKPECELQETADVEKVSLGEFVPEYFFKPIPRKAGDTRNEVSFISQGGNFVMDMNTATVRPEPGPYDGVPTPDGEFIVIPEMNFIDRENITEDSPVLFDDEKSEDADGHSTSLTGVYHSLGVLKQNGNQKTYRGITDTLTTSGGNRGNNLLYKDYTVTINADGTKDFAPNNQPPRPLCSNVTDQLKLPMLAKNGRMLSAYDAESGTTKIFDVKIDDEGNSICDVKVDLGFATSKVEFSPDGENITFAMDSMPTAPDDVSWYSQPPLEKKNMNVFVFNLASRDLKQISKKGKGNSYYPSFSFDGTVVYLTQEVDDDGNTRYFLERSPINEGNETPWVDSSLTIDCMQKTTPKFNALLALGQLWYSTCQEIRKDENAQMNALVAIPNTIDPDACIKLVNSYWNSSTLEEWKRTNKGLALDRKGKKDLTEEEYIRLFQGLSKDDLLATCPTHKTEHHEYTLPTAYLAVESSRKRDPIEICIQCHGPNSSQPLDFRNTRKLQGMKKKLELHVLSGFMPKDMELDEDRRGEILDWIEKKVPDDDAVLPPEEPISRRRSISPTSSPSLYNSTSIFQNTFNGMGYGPAQYFNTSYPITSPYGNGQFGGYGYGFGYGVGSGAGMSGMGYGTSTDDSCEDCQNSTKAERE